MTKSASLTSDPAKLDTRPKTTPKAAYGLPGMTGSESMDTLNTGIMTQKSQSPAAPTWAPTTRSPRRRIRRSISVDNKASSYVAFMIYGRDARVTGAAKQELQKLIENSYKEVVVITRSKCDTLLYLPHLGTACVTQLTNMSSSLAQILYGELV